VKRIVLAAAAALSLAAAPACAAEGVITYKSLAPDVAFDLARNTLNKCRKDGYQVAVVVLDRFGEPLIAMRDRYAGIGAWDIATGKAWTAVNFGRDTSELIKRGNISPALAGQPKITLVTGGLVIQAGGAVLGGIGVAGAPGGENDEACAKAGLESVQDKLEF
jgi:uncharacterized protein GlcG (DUF336 family)